MQTHSHTYSMTTINQCNKNCFEAHPETLNNDYGYFELEIKIPGIIFQCSYLLTFASDQDI